MLQFLILLIYIFPVPEVPVLNCHHDCFVVDHLGNIITIENNEIQKFNSKTDKIASYSNSMLGEIASIDVSNPLRMLVFYKDFNQLMFLDRNLAEIGDEIDLYDYSNNETDLLCSSPNGGFWMYNAIDNQAVHISEFGNTITKSIFISDFFGDISPAKMQVYAKALYILYPEKGILVLDDNGQFKKKISISGIQDFQINQNTIVYSNKSGAFILNDFHKEDRLIYRFEQENTQFVQLYNKQLYLSNKKSITIIPLKF